MNIMQAFPHRYRVTATADVDGDVELTAERLTTLRSASPETAVFDVNIEAGHLIVYRTPMRPGRSMPPGGAQP